MGKYLTDLNDDQVITRLLKWNALLRGRKYRPFLTVRDVPSQGFSHRIKGWRHGRVHHLLSDEEWDTILCLEATLNCLEICEQFALDRERTRIIASQLGIKHPIYVTTKVDKVITTDFLVYISTPSGEKRMAISFKEAVEFDGDCERLLEKLEIERIYWLQENVEFVILTERNLPKMLIENMKIIHAARFYSYKRDNLSNDIIEQIFHTLSPMLLNSDMRLIDAMTECAKAVGMTKQPKNLIWPVVRFFLANQVYCMDLLNNPIDSFSTLALQSTDFDRLMEILK